MKRLFIVGALALALLFGAGAKANAQCPQSFAGGSFVVDPATGSLVFAQATNNSFVNPGFGFNAGYGAGFRSFASFHTFTPFFGFHNNFAFTNFGRFGFFGPSASVFVNRGGFGRNVNVNVNRGGFRGGRAAVRVRVR